MKLAVMFLSAIELAQAQPKLPEGEGREVVERLCLDCHGAENFITRNHTKDGWDEVIYSMESRGLKGTDEEFEIVSKYLTKYIGKSAAKINVNRAAAKELESTLSLASADAEAIVRYRSENGDFKSWQDVAKVPGVDAKKIEAARDRLTF